ncbi:MAG: transposase [Deltaproteobacteria bacterium]|nr:transposase [Deltaproteobacteria bacterium]
MRKAGADKGYYSASNVKKLEAAGIDPYISVRRHPHDESPEGLLPGSDASVTEKMGHKLNAALGKAFCAIRKCVVEPVFGIIKESVGFRGFSFRGLKKVELEWCMVMCCYNFKRMFTLAGR